MRSYLINTKTNAHGEVDITPKLETYHKLIGCDCVDIVRRYVGGLPLFVVVDGEGLLRPNRVGGIALDNEEILAGNILLFGISDDCTDFRGLTDQEVEAIEDNVTNALFEDSSIGCVLTYMVG